MFHILRLFSSRVRAVNNQGESEPLETDTTTLAKDPFDPPGPPENVKLKDWDRRWVKLTWEKPKDDGGARITHYIIEKKEVDFSSKWIKAVATDTDETWTLSLLPSFCKGVSNLRTSKREEK